jgi:hypothetical protein
MVGNTAGKSLLPGGHGQCFCFSFLWIILDYVEKWWRKLVKLID